MTLVDAWQGRGLGSALLARLSERAVEVGVEYFTAEVLAKNRSMLTLLATMGRVETESAGPWSPPASRSPNRPGRPGSHRAVAGERRLGFQNSATSVGLGFYAAPLVTCPAVRNREPVCQEPSEHAPWTRPAATQRGPLGGRDLEGVVMIVEDIQVTWSNTAGIESPFKDPETGRVFYLLVTSTRHDSSKYTGKRPDIDQGAKFQMPWDTERCTLGTSPASRVRGRPRLCFQIKSGRCQQGSRIVSAAFAGLLARVYTFTRHGPGTLGHDGLDLSAWMFAPCSLGCPGTPRQHAVSGARRGYTQPHRTAGPDF